MDSKQLTQLRKFTRILYVCGASLLLAAMVLSMINIPVKAADSDGDGYDDSWDPCPNDFYNTCEIIWCHCGEGTCTTISPSINSLIKENGQGGHIDAQGNILHAGDHSGACVVTTDEPTVVPTDEPTIEPTVEPTEEPTVEPTEEPTVEPTEEPTVEPTEEPTVEPTEEPTVEPTEEPTVEPTEEPTVEPTEEPTVEPTEEPTVEPTEEPTEDPTEDPTQDTTEEPTQNPPQDPNPPAGVLIPVTGIELQSSGILLARSLTLNLGILFFGMAMVCQSVVYQKSKKQ